MEVYALDTPCIVVDRPTLKRNVTRMADLARRSGKLLRPHAKTHKCLQIARMQLSAGAVGLTTAKLSEAACFADDGQADLFIANQVIGPAKIERLAALRRRSRITIAIDSVEGLSQCAPIGTPSEPVRVMIEVDTGLGRAGVRGQAAALNLARLAVDTEGIELVGLFTHEGHVYRQAVDKVRTASRAAAQELLTITHGIRAKGIPLQVLSVGSTPGAAEMASVDGITELRPGTYVFGDAMQVRLGADPGSCALSVLATVTSRPDARSAILDCGTKALGGDVGPTGSRYGLILDQPGAALDWANEEHCHVDLSGCTWAPRIGSKVRVVPNHVCPCVNLHDRLRIVEEDEVIATWRVAARGMLL